MEVSPLLAYDTSGTLAAVKALHARAERPNLFIKIPGTAEGFPAIEEAIFAGVPINVHSCSPARSMSQPAKHTCAAPNGASLPG